MDINQVLQKLNLGLLASVYDNSGAGRAVFHVRQHHTHLQYALKMFDLNLNSEKQILAEMAVLNRLPFGLTPHVHAIEKQGRSLAILVDWIQGKNISELYKTPARDKFDAQQRISIILKAGWRLNRIHRERLFHRDIKPENIVVVGQKNDLNAFIIDFGNAAIKRELEEGTLMYRAPEQYVSRNERVSEKTDVFGLAQTLWFVLSGEPAELEVNEQFNDWLVPEFPELPPGLPQANRLFQLLEEATAFSPQKRPSLVKFLQDLKRVF